MLRKVRKFFFLTAEGFSIERQFFFDLIGPKVCFGDGTGGGVGVLNQLVAGQGAIVGLDDGIGHHWGGHDGKHQQPVRILLPDLGDEDQCWSRSPPMGCVIWKP